MEGVELGADGVLDDGAAAGGDGEESLVDDGAGLSEDFSVDFVASDFESDEESLELESELPELLGA